MAPQQAWCSLQRSALRASEAPGAQGSLRGALGVSEVMTGRPCKEENKRIQKGGGSDWGVVWRFFLLFDVERLTSKVSGFVTYGRFLDSI